MTGDWDWALGERRRNWPHLDRPDRAWFLGNTLVFRCWRGEAADADWAEWDTIVEGHDDPQAASDYADVRAIRAMTEGACRRPPVRDRGLLGRRWTAQPSIHGRPRCAVVGRSGRRHGRP